MINELTGLVVSYNTKELLQKAIESIRSFYPELPILIVDSSTPLSECYEYTKELAMDDNIERIYISGNIGHGKGMDTGLKIIKSKYVLLFDSDIEMKAPRLEAMLHVLGPDLYGVGQVITVDRNGNNSEVGLPYLHPHFCIINRNSYFDFAPFVHHGAPLIKTMIDIYTHGGAELRSFDVPKYVLHEGRGTRKLNPPEFLNNWQ